MKRSISRVLTHRWWWLTFVEGSQPPPFSHVDRGPPAVSGIITMRRSFLSNHRGSKSKPIAHELEGYVSPLMSKVSLGWIQREPSPGYGCSMRQTTRRRCHSQGRPDSATLQFVRRRSLPYSH